MGNSIGHSIGNTIQKKTDFPDTPFTNISIVLQLFMKNANAILKITYIQSTCITDQSKFIENCQYGKEICKMLDLKNMQKRPQAPKPIFLGLESGKSANMVPNFEFFEKYIKDAPTKTVQNGSYTSPKELTRFPNEAKLIWVEIRKHCKHAVII